jgi:hypothetical protein
MGISTMLIASAFAKLRPSAFGNRRDLAAVRPCVRSGSAAKLAGKAEDPSGALPTSLMSPAPL